MRDGIIATMELHKLLARQLSRCELSDTVVPQNLQKWQEFLERISKGYIENDQERYLLERSMEVSSRELHELNKKLEDAQRIAKLGYWFHDFSTVPEKIIWSKEIYRMLDWDAGKPLPSLKDVFLLFHPEDQSKARYIIEKALSEGREFDYEVRIKGADEKYKWYYTIGRPIVEPGKPISKITGITMDISRHKQVEEEVVLLHQQLMSSARRAGMADVATSILHNVGNILNSVNVSVSLIQENINNAYSKKLFSIGDILSEHTSDMEDYLTQDPKGKLILPYLTELLKKIKENNEMLTKEISSLREHVIHIKDITEMQKSLSGVSGILENTSLSEIINAAIRMCSNLEKKNISIIKNFDEKITIKTDKSKLLQILINLIQNAKDALLSSENYKKTKKIHITANQENSDTIQIIVEDNGIGIKPENIIKIFSFGFTTKQNGHGFGLHSSALAANELGGMLEAVSEGEDCRS